MSKQGLVKLGGYIALFTGSIMVAIIDSKEPKETDSKEK